jgi:hypothetical protein
VSILEPSDRPRKVEYRWYLAGREVTPEQFFAELRRLGGRAIVEEVDLSTEAEAEAERGAALYRLLAAGVSVDRLARLDRRVRHAACSDWPGRPPGPEPRRGAGEAPGTEGGDDGDGDDGRAGR